MNPLKTKQTKGRKKSINKHNWKKISTKKLRNQGKTYVTYESGKIIPEKLFKPVVSCCLKKCCEVIDESEQKVLFEKFKKLGDYHKQNLMLSSFLNFNNTKKINSKSKQKRSAKWVYMYCTDTQVNQVCRKFLLKVLQISEKRIRILQKKMINNESLEDFRGVNSEHNLKLTDDLKDLILLHCCSLPHRGSHYASEDTSLRYFENPTLNIEVLYKLFLEYYTAVTGKDNIPFSLSTYKKYFDRHVNFSFQLPRTDVCNICYESKTNGDLSPATLDHKKKAKDYFDLKKKMLHEQDTLCLEFDFAQNLPVPKIPVSEQFFKRLMWIYVFNVHIHNNNKSYMFLLPEGLYKKGANTVCNLVYHVIKAEFDPTKYKKINLFSDGCGGQNRNFMVARFFSSLATNLNTEINFLYPVRGHSFNQCDRNFGVYSKKKKTMERIETQKDYVDLIESARDPPFIVLQENDVTFIDYEKAFDRNIPNLSISKVFLIKFTVDGKIEAKTNYYDKSTVIEIKRKIDFSSILSETPPIIVGMTEAKVQDVKCLLKYLKVESQAFFIQHFEKVGLKKVIEKSVKKEKKPASTKKVKTEEKEIKKKNTVKKKIKKKKDIVIKQLTKKKKIIAEEVKKKYVKPTQKNEIIKEAKRSQRSTIQNKSAANKKKVVIKDSKQKKSSKK